jgi:VWFA-related protein
VLAAAGWEPGAGSRELTAGSRQAPQQTFRSGTQIVQVDVRVHKDGRFVPDLAAADFTITEDGVPQRIESVVFVSGTSAPQAPQAPRAPQAPLAPPAPSVLVFVFDTEHLSAGGLNRTREAVVKFIADRFRQGDVGGVVFDGRMANNRLSTDREELKRAAAAVKLPGEMINRQQELRAWPRLQDDQEAWVIANGDRQALAAAVTRACSDDPDQCRMAPPDVQILEKARRLSAQTRTATLKSLRSAEALSNGLARMPGSKTIVFLSEGFFLTSVEAELRQTVGMAARAGARFYTIDARGLNRGGAGADIIDKQYVDNAAGAQQRFDTQADGTNSLAVDTGGLAIRNENNVGRALDAIQADAATYYVVSYTPSNAVFDGKYRTIDVAVSRPGTKVRARRGYLALEPAALLRPTGAGGAAAAPKRLNDSPGAKEVASTTAEPAPDTAVPPKPSEAAAERVAPKPAGEAAGAKADTLPVAPWLSTLPGIAVSAEPSAPVAASAAGAATSPAVRTRIDGGKMVAELQSAFAPRASPSGVGGTASAENRAADAGWAAYEKGDVVTAAIHLGEAAKAPDARPWVHYALGLAQFAQQRYRDAATAWERVLRDVPEFEPIYFSLADAYGLLGDEGAAIKVLRAAEPRWPADPEISNAIGVMQIRRGALDAAIESFDRAKAIAPADGLGYFNLGRALQMRVLKSQRYDPQLQRWVGGEADRTRAIAAFEKYLELGGPYGGQARDAITALNWR